jgi:hypothetical protein
MSEQSQEPPHPVRLIVNDDLRRSRLMVFFRLPLAIPHLVWLYFWRYIAMVVALLTWICTLVIGRPPRPFHRFLGAYVRYETHVWAFVTLVGNPFPGFVGSRGSYPVDLETPTEPQRQNRLVTLVRIILAIPAFLISAVLMGALLVVAFLGWFASLIRGRMPEGLRDLGAYALRYSGQMNAYVYLQTSRYPHSSPRRDLVVP